MRSLLDLTPWHLLLPVIFSMLTTGCQIYYVEDDLSFDSALLLTNTEARTDKKLRKDIKKALYHKPDKNQGGYQIKFKVHRGLVLLYGNLNDTDTMNTLMQKIQDLEDVRGIHSYVELGKERGFREGLSDWLLPSRVKSFLSESNPLLSSRLEVSAWRRDVFVMGLIFQRECADIVDAIRGQSNIRRLYLLMEVIPSVKTSDEGQSPGESDYPETSSSQRVAPDTLASREFGACSPILLPETEDAT